MCSEAILTLKDLEECKKFFSDLCTVAELRAMEQRFEVAMLLSDGMIYNDILERTGASSATISRVNRSLQYGADGYQAVLRGSRRSWAAMAYEFLAGATTPLPPTYYARWADYLGEALRPQLTIRTVLDLACGTGSLTRVLAERGYEMIGADLSQEMLAQAAEKCRGAGPIEPIFLHQAMEELDLYGTIDACVCCLDSINYVTSPKKLARAFRRVHTFLMPGGLFLFDINTPQKLRGLDGQMFLDESEDAYCVWRGRLVGAPRICTYGMDIFRLEPGGLWSRWEEVHEEYAYEPAELEELLRQAGFRQIRQYGELRFRAPREGEQRIFFAARKEF